MGVFRGFSVYPKTNYRNYPFWEIAFELKKEFPTLPIICDPSHISGNKKLIWPISKDAIDFDFDGLMIEVHNNPDAALSDSCQQVTPKEFELGLKNLNLFN